MSTSVVTAPGMTDTYCTRPVPGSKTVLTHTLFVAPCAMVNTIPAVSRAGVGYTNAGAHPDAQRRSMSAPNRGNTEAAAARTVKEKWLRTWARGSDGAGREAVAATTAP